MARDPDKIPINYLIANGQYVGQSSYNALYDALPGYISNINNDITRYPKLTIEISQVILTYIHYILHLLEMKELCVFWYS